MKKLKIFIKGETINLCKPTLEFARKSNWYKWLNNPKITKNLGRKYNSYINTPKKQEKFFLAEKDKRLLLIISTKNQIYKGVVSLSNINLKKNMCDIAILTDESIDFKNSHIASLEAIARITEFAFKKMKIKKISGTGHIKIRNWQQRMELLGYKLDCFKTNDYSHGKKMDDSFVISCDLSDYLSLKKIRKKYWDSKDKMTKRIKKLPKTSFKDKLFNFNNKDKLKYYRKVFSL